jgi:hypothetical protein
MLRFCIACFPAFAYAFCGFLVCVLLRSDHIVYQLHASSVFVFPVFEQSSYGNTFLILARLVAAYRGLVLMLGFFSSSVGWY